MVHCNQCGWEWEARVPDPSTCPKCKRYDWREPKKGDGYAKIAGKRPPGQNRRPAGAVSGKPDGVEGGQVATGGCKSCGGLNGVHQKGCKR